MADTDADERASRLPGAGPGSAPESAARTVGVRQGALRPAPQSKERTRRMNADERSEWANQKRTVAFDGRVTVWLWMPQCGGYTSWVTVELIPGNGVGSCFDANYYHEMVSSHRRSRRRGCTTATRSSSFGTGSTWPSSKRHSGASRTMRAASSGSSATESTRSSKQNPRPGGNRDGGPLATQAGG